MGCTGMSAPLLAFKKEVSKKEVSKKEVSKKEVSKKEVSQQHKHSPFSTFSF
jgi:hypothetical protein